MAIFFAMPGNEELARHLSELTSGELGELEVRRFPDGETYVRIRSDVRRRHVYLICTLAHPDPQFLGLSYAAAEISQQGAKDVALIAPYLAYLRQDRIFHPGEALTSRIFAQLLQQHFRRLITVDPHLHRHASLAEVYDIPSSVVQIAPLFAAWIAANVDDPVLIGPDAESAQWVEEIARQAGVPWTVFKKQRQGDRRVQITASDLAAHRARAPVLVDDIVSSGTTMKQALGILRNKGFKAPICLAIHSLCTARTARYLRDNSAGFLTSNTVPNAYAAFDVAPLIADVLVSRAALTPNYAA